VGNVARIVYAYLAALFLLGVVAEFIAGPGSVIGVIQLTTSALIADTI